MTFRIAQISDTHLSDAKPFFVANFECVARAADALEPDLVINTGDLALDGTGHEGDLEAAARRHRIFARPVRFIPGNHDLGDSPEVPNAHGHTIDAVRRDAYLRHFGADWWRIDVPGWRLIGLNAQLCGSGLEADNDQLAFVHEATRGAEAKQIALFIHKPLFDLSDDEEVLGGRFLPPVSRRRLWQAFGERRPALVASGHVHQYRATRSEGMNFVWAPSAAYFIPDSRQPRYGLKQVGFASHDLAEDGSHTSRFVSAAGTKDLSIADFPQAYGPMD